MRFAKAAFLESIGPGQFHLHILSYYHSTLLEYVVPRGECENQVKVSFVITVCVPAPTLNALLQAFAGAAYKKFPTLAGAEAFMGSTTPLVSVSRPEERVPSSSFPASSHDGEWKEIFTDGACRGNGQANSVAGVGVWFGDNHPGSAFA
jgi:hypothetical protein